MYFLYRITLRSHVAPHTLHVEIVFVRRICFPFVAVQRTRSIITRLKGLQPKFTRSRRAAAVSTRARRKNYGPKILQAAQRSNLEKTWGGRGTKSTNIIVSRKKNPIPPDSPFQLYNDLTRTNLGTKTFFFFYRNLN